jgi:hypothetical protein
MSSCLSQACISFNIQSLSRFIFLLVFMFTISACGGGSGGGQNDSSRPVNSRSSTGPSSISNTTSSANTNSSSSSQLRSSASSTTYSLPSQRPFIPVTDFMSPACNSEELVRLKNWVDLALETPQYDSILEDAIIIYSRAQACGWENPQQYINHAVSFIDAFVTSEQALIDAGNRPSISGDSYLEIGHHLQELSLAYDWGYDLLTPTQRERWAAYANRALHNVWDCDHNSEFWLRTNGSTMISDPQWSCWSINDPGNNYHFSFLKATMTWAMASQDTSWFNYLQANKFPQLIAYYSQLTGGGSREGTGYGTAHMNLFEIYRLWRTGTGEDLAARTDHTRDTIDYWVHATTPNRNRFAAIGDQSRVSEPEIYDYHEHLVREAVILASGTDQARRGVWWIENNSLPRMSRYANAKFDLLKTQDQPLAPTALSYHATGVGHFFARNSWATDATWMAFVAGPYDQSHAHQEQGSFTLWRNTWLAVTSNIFSHSGIEQSVDRHNTIRFVSGGNDIPQTENVAIASSMTYSDQAGVVIVDANLRNAFSANNALVQAWTRHLELEGNQLRVTDACTVAAGVTPVWQVHTPAQPIIQGDGSVLAGNLRITAVTPAPSGNITILSIAGNSPSYRVEIRNPSGCAFSVNLNAL